MHIAKRALAARKLFSCHEQRKVYVILYTCNDLLALSMWFTVVLICSVLSWFLFLHVFPQQADHEVTVMAGQGH